MKYLKLQSDLIKAAEKRDGWKNECFKYKYGIKDDVIVIISNFKFWVIPLSNFYLDINKVFPFEQIHNLDLFIRKAEYEVTFTGLSKIIDKKNLLIFDCNGKSVYIDESLLKDFDIEYSSLRGNDEKSPIQIYENDVLVGAVLPVRVKG